MTARRYIIIWLLIPAMIIATGILTAEDELPPPPDSTIIDSLPTATEKPNTDSLFEAIGLGSEPSPAQILIPEDPVYMGDTLMRLYSRIRYPYEVRDYDLYPRDAGEMLHQEASYYTLKYSETPLRTTVQPFGLPLAGIAVSSGPNNLQPQDHVIPGDGMIDFEDIATGNIEAVYLVEGPLSGYNEVNSGISRVWIKPDDIPEKEAESEFTVERGAFGYAYTRANIARMLSRRYGFFASTDYRKGDSYDPDNDDDMYNINLYLLGKFGTRTVAEAWVDSYHRRGGFEVQPDSGGYRFARERREQNVIFSLTRHNTLNGQLRTAFAMHRSRSDYSNSTTTFYRKVEPQNYFTDISYLTYFDSALVEFSLHAEHEIYEDNGVKRKRNLGWLQSTGLFDLAGGRLTALARLYHIESDKSLIDASLAFTRYMGQRWRLLLSAGMNHRQPTQAELFSPTRSGVVGDRVWSHYTELSNPELETEKRLTGNATLVYFRDYSEFSLAINAGSLKDAIIYRYTYAGDVSVTSQPINDDIKYVDLNLRTALEKIGPLFLRTSLTARKLDSDLYGNRPPYSPRWQIYGQAGLKFYISRYKINVRLFGDITYTEKVLTTQLEELIPSALITGGFNLNLKDLTFYYMIHDASNQLYEVPEGYGFDGWYYTWGFNWKFFN